jgi:uncharacterized repeat protein (TIGR03803 family)
MTKLSVWRTAGAVFVLYAATASAARAQVFTTLADFKGEGSPEYMSLVQGRDANLYGTAVYGGNSLLGGTLFKITTRGLLSELYSFCDDEVGCAGGAEPFGGLIQATNGNFYGTTATGGVPASGTIFKITPAGTLTTLYTFCSSYPCTDGAYPYGTLIQAADGNFYGTTYSGGTSTNCSGFGCGTVFKINPSGSLTTLHNFTLTDGASPYAGLIEAVGGDFYGTTYSGGANGQGSVFKITRLGTLTTVYSFCALANCADGQGPTAGLSQGIDGNFYGTTVFGGASGDGTVFKITPRGRLSTLHSFDGTDSSGPTAGLVQGNDGYLYGTTFAAYVAGDGYGTIFKISTEGDLTMLYRFCSQPNCSDGAYPVGGLVQATNGIFYGTTTGYGAPDCVDSGFGFCGTVFSLDMSLGPFVAFVRGYGRVGRTIGILGQGFTGATSVLLNGTPANFTVVSDTLIRATVPAGATTGYVTVTTPSGTLKSNVPFHVIP